MNNENFKSIMNTSLEIQQPPPVLQIQPSQVVSAQTQAQKEATKNKLKKDAEDAQKKADVAKWNAISAGTIAGTAMAKAQKLDKIQSDTLKKVQGDVDKAKNKLEETKKEVIRLQDESTKIVSKSQTEVQQVIEEGKKKVEKATAT